MVFGVVKDYVCTVWSEEYRRENLGFGRVPRRHLAQPSWFRHRSWYSAWRVATCVYLTLWCFLSALLGSDWVTRPANRIKYFIFFSDWNFILMTAAACLQMFVTVTYRQDEDDDYGPDDEDPNYEPRVHEKVMWLLYTVSTDCSLIVSTFFWCFLYKGTPPSVVTVHLHVINSLYVLVDLCLNAIPIRALHVMYTLGYGVIYSMFVLIYKLAGGTNGLDEPFIYWILDWNYPLRAMFFTMIGVGSAIPAHFIIFCIYKVRQKLAKDNEGDASLPLLES